MGRKEENGEVGASLTGRIASVRKEAVGVMVQAARKSESDDDEQFERLTGKHIPKGVMALRLERQLAPIIERWRAAVKRDPEAWK